MSLVLDAPAICDAALAAATTYMVIKGTLEPYKADKIKPKGAAADKNSAIAPGKDLVTQMHITSTRAVIYPLVVVEGAVAIWRILCPSSDAADRRDWLSGRGLWRLANLVAIAGGLGRFWCYRTLGKHFTFDLRVNPDHKIVQSGPYSLVRHPSYTAIFLLSIGGTISQILLSPGVPLAWRQSFGVRTTVTTIIVGTALLIYRRIVEEESMLQKDPSIGQQYKAYMRKVRSRFLPGLL